MLNVGIDWAQATALQYVILSDDGDKIKDGSFERTLDGIDRFAETLETAESNPKEVRVGIDRKHDIVCEVLFSKGFKVYPLTPHSTDAARKAYHPAGNKDDKTDAMLHANMVRKDGKHLKPYRPQKETDVLLRELLSARNSLVDKKKMLKQELNSFLSSYAPVLGNLTGDLCLVWQKQLLKKWPLDQDFLGAHGNELNAFINKHKLGSSTVAKIRRQKRGRSVQHSRSVVQCHRMLIRQKVELIEACEKEISKLEQKISDQCEKHRDREIFSSLPTESDQTQAALCIAFDENEKEHRSWRNYASYFGTAPVTKSSGKNKRVKMRRAYDRIINKALMDLADSTSRLENCWACHYYRRKRAAGKGHYETLRQLALKWVKITHAMWRNRSKYDENYISTRFGQGQPQAA